MKKNGEYVGVDEKYVPEEEKYVDNQLNGEIKDGINQGLNSAKNYLSDEENKQKIKKAGRRGVKILKGVGVGYLVIYAIVFILVIAVFVIVFTNMAKMGGMTNKIMNVAQEEINKGQNETNKVIDQAQEKIDNSEKDHLTSVLEMYSGTKRGHITASVLDNIVTFNKKNKNDRITVIYQTTSTSVPEEIIALKDNFDNFEEYEISYDYDDNGFINQVTIFDK